MASALWPDYVPPEPPSPKLSSPRNQTASRTTIRSGAPRPVYSKTVSGGGRVVVASPTAPRSSYEAKRPRNILTFTTDDPNDWQYGRDDLNIEQVSPGHMLTTSVSSDPDCASKGSSSSYFMDVPTSSYAIPSDDDRDADEYEDSGETRGDGEDTASAMSSEAGSRTASSRRSAASSSKPSGASSGSAGRSGAGESSHSSSFLLSNRRDQAETNIKLFVWHRASYKPSTGAALAKAPLLRDVPNNMKRKLTGKRDSTSAPRFDATSPVSSDRGISFKNAAPAWLRERPSKAKLTVPPVSTTGAWKRATAIFRENGVLSIYGDDRSLIVAIVTQHLASSDIRIVDGSLFSRPFVLGVFARPSPFGQQSTLPSPMLRTGPFASNASKASVDDRDEPLYLCFPTAGKLQRWRALLKMYAAPEVYGPPSTAERGGTYRTYRQIDMTLFEAKATVPLRRKQVMQETRLAEGRLSPTVMNRSMSKGLDDAAEAQAQAQAQANVQQSIDEALASINERDEMTMRGTERPTLRQSLSVSNISSADADELDSAGTSLHGDVAAQDSSNVPLDEDDDDGVYESGPISGGPAQAGESEGDLSRSFVGAGVGGKLIREEKEKEKEKHSIPAECYCLVSYGGVPAARTRVRQAPASAGGSIVWVEKFTFSDLPALNSMRVDVFQSAKASSSSGTTSSIGLSEASLGLDNSGTGAKFSLLGSVDLPMDTMRRGEDVEGWFPIWGPTAHTKDKEGDSGILSSKDLQGAHDDSSRSYNRMVVGELKMTIRVREEAILPLRKYATVEKVLNGTDSTALVRDLSRHLDEDTVLSHLVDVYVSGGTIVSRLEELASKETHLFGSAPGLQQESELLFRANTVLSRSLDKFQRLYCIDWLDSSIGVVVRRVCEERIWLDSDDSNVGSISPSGSGGFDGKGGPKRSDREVVESLRKLCDELWSCIYSSRHECPPDLSRILADLRSKVNNHFTQLQSPAPGIQGVGAFVFLRLICPAITTPHLYGLMAAPPDLRSSRTLMLLAKTFLALANKRSAFDKDKEPWLSQMNPFLRAHSLAYEDYITVVSTMPPSHAVSKQVPLGDEDDVPLQMAVQRRLSQLTALHRESIPSAVYMLDRPLAIASLVSYVVRSSHLRGGLLDDGSSFASGGGGGGPTPASEASDDRGAKHSGPTDDRITPFVELCCEIEEQTGYYIERAGFAARPLDVPPWPSQTSTSGSSLIVSAGRSTRVSVGDKSSSPASGRLRRATVSNALSTPVGVKVVKDDAAGRGPTTSVVDEDSFLRTKHRLPLRYGPTPRSPAQPGVSGSGSSTSTGLQQQQRQSFDHDQYGDSDDELRMAYATFNAEERSGAGSSTVVPREAGRRHSSDLSRVAFAGGRYSPTSRNRPNPAMSGSGSGGAIRSVSMAGAQLPIYSGDEGSGDDMPQMSHVSGLGAGPHVMGAVPQRVDKVKKKKWWKA